jgi:hypothetical protein
MKKEHPSLSHAGLGLLDRRQFLGLSGTGLGGIALTALLSEAGLLKARAMEPIRPDINGARPLRIPPPGQIGQIHLRPFSQIGRIG